MKAITLTQPWATLVAVGAKKIETRSWTTTYRGELAIHAAKGIGRESLDAMMLPPFKDALRKAGYMFLADLPRASVIATVTLVDVVPCDKYLRVSGISHDEQAFGDFGQGRYAWFMQDVKRVEPPVPAVGHLSLWEWYPPLEGEP